MKERNQTNRFASASLWPPEGSRGVCHSPSLQSDKITDNKDFKKWIDSYLGVGEWVMDQSVAVLGTSSFFERKR